MAQLSGALAQPLRALLSEASMREQLAYGRLKRRTFTFTRRDIQENVQAHIRAHARVIVPIPGETVRQEILFHQDGLDGSSEAQGLVNVIDTYEENLTGEDGRG